jgi:hypothetical protein
MIEVLASGGREGLMDARPSDGELHVLTKMPLCGLVLYSSCRGTSVFSGGPIYRRRGLNFQPTLGLEAVVLFHFGVLWERGREGRVAL